MSILIFRKLPLFSLALLPLLGLPALFAPPASAQAQESVAEAARRAREQKKEEPKPQKVYTDDDVKRMPDTISTATATTDSAPKDADKKTASDANKNRDAAKDEKGEKNDEATWRGKFKDAYNNLAAAEKELDILQRENEKAQVQYYPDPQKALEQQYTRKDINAERQRNRRHKNRKLPD